LEAESALIDQKVTRDVYLCRILIEVKARRYVSRVGWVMATYLLLQASTQLSRNLKPLRAQLWLV
jgi:hypothetical protein